MSAIHINLKWNACSQVSAKGISAARSKYFTSVDSLKARVQDSIDRARPPGSKSSRKESKPKSQRVKSKALRGSSFQSRSSRLMDRHRNVSNKPIRCFCFPRFRFRSGRMS